MTHEIKFEDGDQEYMMVVEKTDSGAYRLIIIERDEDTGARCVRDILEMPVTVLGAWIINCCELYNMNLLSDVRMAFTDDHIDLGRAYTLKGWAKKVQDHAISRQD